MIVIANKTEKYLLRDLRRCLKESPAQKCFFMEFSKSSVSKKALFETFLKSLEDLPNSYMAQVYLCHDKDIFILMQGFMQRQFVEFIHTLSATLGTKEFFDMIDVFEVGVHWEKLEGLCKDKLLALDNEKARQEEEKRKVSADQMTLKVFERLDTSLITDLSQRRNLREEINILIVDDDELSRTLVGNVLSKDFPMSYAKDGSEALHKYLECAPDVMFLDIGLPDISGHDVLECLFQFDPEAYVIMFSGRKDQANIVRALETGAQGFVGKPFTRNKLFEYIQKSPFVIDKKPTVKNVKSNIS